MYLASFWHLFNSSAKCQHITPKLLNDTWVKLRLSKKEQEHRWSAFSSWSMESRCMHWCCDVKLQRKGCPTQYFTHTLSLHIARWTVGWEDLSSFTMATSWVEYSFRSTPQHAIWKAFLPAYSPPSSKLPKNDLISNLQAVQAHFFFSVFQCVTFLALLLRCSIFMLCILVFGSLVITTGPWATSWSFPNFLTASTSRRRTQPHVCRNVGNPSV